MKQDEILCDKCNKKIKNKGVMVKTGVVDKELNLPVVKFYHKNCYGVIS